MKTSELNLVKATGVVAHLWFVKAECLLALLIAVSINVCLAPNFMVDVNVCRQWIVQFLQNFTNEIYG